ncbi:MAG: response regulator [Candidatus Delongbacteria bacterium]|nr:response regulator [Candidatus Delongbacteria bacterium]
MKRLLKIDEENITRTNLRISSGIFTVVLLIFMGIYIPKYFSEYRALQEKTERDHVTIYKNKMKSDVLQLKNTLKYRVRINKENIKESIIEQSNIYYSVAKSKYEHYKLGDGFNNKTILDLLIRDFSELFSKDKTGLSFIGYNNFLEIYKDGKILIKSEFDWSKIKEDHKNEILNNKLLTLENCFDKLMPGSNDQHVYINYLKELKLFVGKIYCDILTTEQIENDIIDEINSSYQTTQEDYIFIYKILNMDGGKDFARMIVNPNRKDLLGNLISDDYRDLKGNYFRREFMKGIREKGEAFSTYYYKSPKNSLIYPKTAYFNFFKEFNWVISKGFYYDQINKIIEADTVEHRKSFVNRIILLISLMFSALVSNYYIFKFVMKKQEKRLLEYKNSFITKNNELLEEIERSVKREKNLESMSRYITDLYELIPVGIVLIKASDKTIARINQSALNMLGFKKEDIIGKKCNLCFCPALEDSCPIIDKGQILDNSERSIINSENEIIPVLKNAKKININDEHFILESFIDITDIKKTHDELIELREKAEQANISKSRFLANMSHEIRTPMNVIMGMSNLLIGTETDTEKKDLLESIKISSESLLNIINDILDLSKIESGKYTIENIPFNFYKLLSSIKDISIFKAKEKNIEFSIEYENDDVPNFIIGDQVKLKQILVNLIGNAIKFTGDGYVKLLLDSKILSNNEVRIKFSVIDTGIGISEKALKHIFERFSQADISTTRKYGGTGLGLTICEKLLSIMGSKLDVRSVENKGSEFFFELSFKLTDSTGITTEDEILSSELKDLRGYKILIAEDNILNQKLIGAIMNQQDLDYTIVNNGKEVIEMLNNEQFDVILMDGQMPVMDGLEATKNIRNSKNAYNNIPIIALTASALIGDRKKFLDAGMNDYISKPIDTVELFEKLLYYTSGIPIEKDVLSEKNKEMCGTDTSGDQYTLLNLKDFEEKKKIFSKDTYVKILNILIEDIDKKFDTISSSVENDDMSTLKLNTHSLKGIVTNFDVPLMNELCIELDNLAINENIKMIKLQLDKIEMLLPQYKTEILNFMATL